MTVAGANGIGAYPCVRFAPTCNIVVQGTAMAANDVVQVVDSALCSAATTTAQSVNFVYPRAGVSVNSGPTQKTFALGTGSLQGVFRACYCPSYNGCDDNADFTHQAGFITVRGPTGSENQACIAGVQCTLGSFTGQTLSSDDRVTESASCCFFLQFEANSFN